MAVIKIMKKMGPLSAPVPSLRNASQEFAYRPGTFSFLKLILELERRLANQTWGESRNRWSRCRLGTTSFLSRWCWFGFVGKLAARKWPSQLEAKPHFTHLQVNARRWSGCHGKRWSLCRTAHEWGHDAIDGWLPCLGLLPLLRAQCCRAAAASAVGHLERAKL